MKFKIILSSLILTIAVPNFANQSKTQDLNPPVAEKIDFKLELHGETRVDSYYWLKERKNPKVIELLKKENSYYDHSFSAADKALQKQMVNEAKSKIEEKTDSVPVKYGAYYYFQRFEKGKDYAIHCRNKNGDTKLCEVVLDENKWAKGKKYFAIIQAKVSPDLKWMAYSLDYEGSGMAEVVTQNLESKKLSKFKVTEDYWGFFDWAPDSQSIFGVHYDKAFRPNKITQHFLAGGQKEIFEDKDQEFSVDCHLSSDKKILFISSWTYTSSKAYFLNESGSLSEVVPYKKNVILEFIDHNSKGFFVSSNQKNTNFELYNNNRSGDDILSWKNLYSSPKNSRLLTPLLTDDKVIFTTRAGAVDTLHFFDLISSQDKPLDLKEADYSVSIEKVGDNNELRMNFTSALTPDSVFRVNENTLALELLKKKDSPTFKADDYNFERQQITSRDGKKIPVSVLYKKNLALDGKNPMLIYAYGAYGLTDTSYFNPSLFSLLDRGWVFVNAHVRGSNANGEEWYNDGRLRNKINTINDFIDVTRALQAKKYSSPAYTCITGASAGGLVIGGSINTAPELFRAAIAEVPFVDVLTTMSDTSIPLTTQEYSQWGNPNIKDDYLYMKKYSPYDNVKAQNYPAVLAVTGINDHQVEYFEPAKFVEKLRQFNQSKKPIYLRTNFGSGHQGESGRYSKFKEIAEQYDFLLKQVQ